MGMVPILGFPTYRMYWLITFTPDPPSTIVPGTSHPLMITVAGLLVPTTTGPSSGFEKKAGAGAKCGGANIDFSSSVNQGTNCNS